MPRIADDDPRLDEGNDVRGGLVPLTFDTHTAFPDRPRTTKAGYDSKTHTIRIEFARPGNGPASYNYYDCDYNDWRAVQRALSTGRRINNRLNSHPYGPAE